MQVRDEFASILLAIAEVGEDNVGMPNVRAKVAPEFDDGLHPKHVPFWIHLRKWLGLVVRCHRNAPVDSL